MVQAALPEEGADGSRGGVLGAEDKLRRLQNRDVGRRAVPAPERMSAIPDSMPAVQSGSLPQGLLRAHLEQLPQIHQGRVGEAQPLAEAPKRIV